MNTEERAKLQVLNSNFIKDVGGIIVYVGSFGSCPGRGMYMDITGA